MATVLVLMTPEMTRAMELDTDEPWVASVLARDTWGDGLGDRSLLAALVPNGEAQEGWLSRHSGPPGRLTALGRALLHRAALGYQGPLKAQAQALVSLLERSRAQDWPVEVV